MTLESLESRFGIDIGLPEAHQRFVNRVHNEVWSGFAQRFRDHGSDFNRPIATALGRRYDPYTQGLAEIVGDDFLANLRAIEAFCEALEPSAVIDLIPIVDRIVAQSEVDLEIEFNAGVFLHKGAPLLDRALIKDPLAWLRGSRLDRVRAPFEKGLRHLLTAQQRPEVLADVVTDMYEALEALAQHVTKRDTKDLSANRESFVAALKCSDGYRALLKDYIDLANRYRHPENEKKPRPQLTEREVEAFVYLTGTFIRLAIPASA